MTFNFTLDFWNFVRRSLTALREITANGFFAVLALISAVIASVVYLFGVAADLINMFVLDTDSSAQIGNIASGAPGVITAFLSDYPLAAYMASCLAVDRLMLSIVAVIGTFTPCLGIKLMRAIVNIMSPTSSS